MAYLGGGLSGEVVRQQSPPSIKRPAEEIPVEPKELTLEDVLAFLDGRFQEFKKDNEQFQKDLMNKVQAIEDIVSTVRIEVPKEVPKPIAVPVQRFQKAFGKGKKRWWWMSLGGERGTERKILSEEEMQEMGLKYGEEVEE